MTRRRLQAAGWLAMTSALLAIPLFIVSFELAAAEGASAKWVEGGLTVAGTALFVYLTVTLRTLLHDCHGFHDADRVIALLIKANVVLTVVAMAGLSLPQLAEGAGLFTIVCFPLLGILNALFGWRLLRLADDLHGLLRPYCYLNIATGICLALVVAAPLALLTGAIGDVMLGTIFFNSAKSLLD